MNREPELSEGDELDALTRAYPGVVQRLRVENLGRQLRKSNGLAVAECRRGLWGDRLTMWLDRGHVLRLRLFWPIHGRGVAALKSIEWDDKVGWIVDVRNTAGDPERIYAWLAQVEPGGVADAV